MKNDLWDVWEIKGNSKRRIAKRVVSGAALIIANGMNMRETGWVVHYFVEPALPTFFQRLFGRLTNK